MAGSDSIFNPVAEDEDANWWMTQLFTLVAGLGCGMIAHLLAKHFRGQAAPTRFISFLQTCPTNPAVLGPFYMLTLQSG